MPKSPNELFVSVRLGKKSTAFRVAKVELFSADRVSNSDWTGQGIPPPPPSWSVPAEIEQRPREGLLSYQARAFGASLGGNQNPARPSSTCSLAMARSIAVGATNRRLSLLDATFCFRPN